MFVAGFINVDLDRVRLVLDVEFHFLFRGLKNRLRFRAVGPIGDHFNHSPIVAGDFDRALDVITSSTFGPAPDENSSVLRIVSSSSTRYRDSLKPGPKHPAAF